MPHAVAEEPTAAVDHLLDVWELAHDPELDFGDRLEQLLELETAAFDLPYGFLTRIDRTTGEQTIETAYGSHDQLQDGKVAPLSESYCRKTIQQSSGVFHIDEASAEGWRDDPAYERFQLETYLGVSLGGERSPYGTLCFASTDPRKTPVSDSERRLAKLLALWVYDARRARFVCDCGASVSLPTDPSGEIASGLTCEDCGGTYAVTISRLD